MAWRLIRRWTHDGDLDWPMLESSMARQRRGGSISVGDASLSCGRDPAWLFASPKTERWAAGYHGPTAAPVTLTVPGGQVRVESMVMGTIVWDRGSVTVDAVGLVGVPEVSGGRLVQADEQ